MGISARLLAVLLALGLPAAAAALDPPFEEYLGTYNLVSTTADKACLGANDPLTIEIVAIDQTTAVIRAGGQSAPMKFNAATGTMTWTNGPSSMTGQLTRGAREIAFDFTSTATGISNCVYTYHGTRPADERASVEQATGSTAAGTDQPPEDNERYPFLIAMFFLMLLGAAVTTWVIEKRDLAAKNKQTPPVDDATTKLAKCKALGDQIAEIRQWTSSGSAEDAKNSPYIAKRLETWRQILAALDATGSPDIGKIAAQYGLGGDAGFNDSPAATARARIQEIEEYIRSGTGGAAESSRATAEMSRLLVERAKLGCDQLEAKSTPSP